MTSPIIQTMFHQTEKNRSSILGIFCLSLIFSGVLNFATAYAQEDVAKNFRFGIKMSPNISWFAPFDKKKLQSDGASLKFSYGLITEFRLNKSASFATGLEMNYSGGTLSFTPTDSVFYVSDEELPAGSYSNFFIAKRKYQMRYVDIPLTMKLRTPEIGSMTYFGQIGANLSIRTKVKSVDDGELVNVTVSQDSLATVKVTRELLTIEDVDITKDVNFFRVGLNIGFGLEYNLIGTTMLTTSLNFYQGFTNVLKGESDFLKDKKGRPYEQSVKNHFFMINVGLLF
jgi:long-subunit fatty acid transport protein